MRDASSPASSGSSLPASLERVQVVAAADMRVADEDLRHGLPPFARSIISLRRSRSPLTSISVKAAPLLFSSALAAWQ